MENCPIKGGSWLRNYLPFLKTEGPLPCSYELNTGFYPESVKLCLQPDIFM